MIHAKIGLCAVLVAALIATTPVVAQDTSADWDGLVEVKAKRLDKVYLAPDADFRGYTKVMIDPTEVAFKKNWQRDQNRERFADRVSDQDARRILDDARESFQKEFAEAYAREGYQVVSTPGPDVLRLSTAIINLDVVAPDVAISARTRTYSRDAGEATLVIEVRDSLSGELLGRALDRQESSDMSPHIRNSVTNAVEFEQIFRRWAKTSADGLTDLKELSPVSAAPAAQ